MRGHARNSSTFIPKSLGLYLIASGVPRRVIETLNQFGVCTGYTTLNRRLNEMAKFAKKLIKQVAHDPSGVIVYDNFNFTNTIKELARMKQSKFINLTTSYLVSYPELNGPLLQE